MWIVVKGDTFLAKKALSYLISIIQSFITQESKALSKTENTIYQLKQW